jgi:hypothetical protein
MAESTAKALTSPPLYEIAPFPVKKNHRLMDTGTIVLIAWEHPDRVFRLLGCQQD